MKNKSFDRAKLPRYHRGLAKRKTKGDLELIGRYQYFSTAMPELEIKTANAKRKLIVTVSSSTPENDRLLHLLSEKLK